MNIVCSVSCGAGLNYKKSSRLIFVNETRLLEFYTSNTESIDDSDGFSHFVADDILSINCKVKRI